MGRLVACTVEIAWRIFIFIPLFLGAFAVWEMLEGHEAMPAPAVRKIIQSLFAVLFVFEDAIWRYKQGLLTRDVAASAATN